MRPAAQLLFGQSGEEPFDQVVRVITVIDGSFCTEFDGRPTVSVVDLSS